MASPTCTECGRKAHAKSLCPKHYAEARRRAAGKPEQPRPNFDTPAARIAARAAELRLVVAQASALLEMAEHADLGTAPGYRDEARRLLADA